MCSLYPVFLFPTLTLELDRPELVLGTHYFPGPPLHVWLAARCLLLRGVASAGSCRSPCPPAWFLKCTRNPVISPPGLAFSCQPSSLEMQQRQLVLLFSWKICWELLPVATICPFDRLSNICLSVCLTMKVLCFSLSILSKCAQQYIEADKNKYEKLATKAWGLYQKKSLRCINAEWRVIFWSILKHEMSSFRAVYPVSTMHNFLWIAHSNMVCMSRKSYLFN